MSERRRGSSLSPTELWLLRQWGRQLCEAFDEMPYLVGSVARAERYRDVDVRLVLPNDDFFACEAYTERRLALNVAISLWGQHVTGLPIDFQFQTAAENATHHGEPRNPLTVVRR